MVCSSLACCLRNSRQSWVILSIASAGMRVLMLKFCDSTSCTSTPCGVIWIFLIGNCCGCASAGCSSCFGSASRRGDCFGIGLLLFSKKDIGVQGSRVWTETVRRIGANGVFENCKKLIGKSKSLFVHLQPVREVGLTAF